MTKKKKKTRTELHVVRPSEQHQESPLLEDAEIWSVGELTSRLKKARKRIKKLENEGYQFEAAEAKQRKARLMEFCELPAGTESLTFENFNQIPGTEEAYAAALDLARGGAKALLWLTLVAPPDRGKTHLAIAACRQRVDQTEPALYRFVPDLLRELRKGYDNHEYDERFERYCEVPLLVLDDLGAENQTPWVQEQIDSIIDHRYVRRLPLIITTNLRADQLAPRVRSRIQRATWGKVVTVTSGEYRLEKQV